MAIGVYRNAATSIDASLSEWANGRENSRLDDMCYPS